MAVVDVPGHGTFEVDPFMKHILSQDSSRSRSRSPVPQDIGGEVDGLRVSRQEDCFEIHGKVKNIVVKSVKMSPINDIWDIEEDQIGVIVYLNDNIQPGTNQAELILIDTYKIDKERPQGATRHAVAYRIAYEKDPADVNNIVATGFSNQRDKAGLVFNSRTFNAGENARCQTESNYANPGKEASPLESKLIQHALQKWSETNFEEAFTYYVEKKK